MNKIFKVIWSKTRNCYVVASELAKGTSKSTSTGRMAKRAALAAVAALLLFPAGIGNSYAKIDSTTINSTSVITGTQDDAAKISGTVMKATNNANDIGNLKTAMQNVETELNQHQDLINNLGTDKLTLSSDNTLQQESYDSTKKTTTKTDVTGLKVAGQVSAESGKITNSLEVGHNVNVGSAVNAGSLNSRGNLNVDGNALVKGTLTSQSTINGNEIVSQTNITAKNKVVGMQGVVDNTLTSGNYVTAGNTVGKNIVALDTQVKANADAIAKKANQTDLDETNAEVAKKADASNVYTKAETDLALSAKANAINEEATAREKEDARLNSEIVNTNKSLNEAATNLSKLNTAVVEGFKTLNQADANEAKARDAADKTLQKNIYNEAAAREAADVEEKAGRVAADTKLMEAVNGGLSLGNGNVLQTNKTSVEADGTVSTFKEPATTLVMNEGKDNQITLSEKGIKVGKNSGVMDKDGFYAGGDNADAAAAALKADGSIKGANGNFTVDGTTGDVSTNGSFTAASGKIGNVSMSADGTMTGVKDLTASGKITADSFTDGTATMSNGSLNGVNQINATGNIVTTGNMKAHDITAEGTIKGETINGTTGTFGSLSTTGNASVGGTLTTNGITNTGNTTTDTLAVNHNATVGGNLSVTGDITGKSLNVGTGSISGGQITGTGLDVGAGTIKTTGATETGTLKTTGKAEIGGDLSVAGNTEMKGKLDVKGNLSVEGEFNANTLSSKLGENNYTEIHGGNVTSVNSKVDITDGKTYTSTSTLTEKGKTETASNGINRNVNKMDATESSNVITNDTNGKTSTFEQRVDEILNQINSSDTVFSKVDQQVNNITSEVTDGTNTTSSTQTIKDITNTAEQGTITNNAKNLSNSASESITNTAGNSITNTATNGDITNNALNGTLANNAKNIANTTTENMTNVVGGNLTNTVTGNMTSSAKNISNTATEALTNTAKDITNNASNNITNIAAETLTNQGKNVATIASETASTNAKNITNTASENITNTASNGTITNEAKDLVNHATEDMTNTVDRNLTTTVGNDMTTTVTGKTTENYNGGLETTITGEEKHTVNGDQTNTITGKQTTTVTGDSSLTAENITNEAKNKITNKAIDVKTDATSSIVNKVANDYGSNTSTQLSYQTKEEMSQSDGKTASYLRGAAEEKSQLTDGDKKTTIDTIAGQTNTNITDGTNTSNSLQKADQVASSVTDGTNTTVVNQDAMSLASSITDGTKANNTNNTVDKSEQLIKADDTHSYAETKTAGSAVEALKSDGNMIIIGKDAATATVSSAVTDGTNTTGSTMTAKGITNSAAESIVNEIGDGSKVKSEMTAKDITNTAKDGTITNDAKDVLNKGINSVINEVGNNQVAVTTGSVKATYGSDTYTTWDASGITSATSGDMKNSAKNITNSATEKLSNSAAEIENKATTSIKNSVGKNVSNSMTTSKITESVKNGANTNTFTKTADKDINIVTDGTSSSTLSQLAGSVNTSLKEVDGEGKTTKSLNNEQTVSEDTTKITDATSGNFSSRSQKANGFTNQVKNGNGGSNTVTDTATTSEQQLVSGNIIDILKDADNGWVKTTVKTSDNSSNTSVNQGTADITNTAKQGTITNDAKNLVNKAEEKLSNSAVEIENTATTSIKDVVGKSTVTTTDAGTTFENAAHATVIGEGTITKTTISGNTLETGKVTADYVDVNKDLNVKGNTKLDGTLEVGGKSTFKDDVTMEKNLEVKGTTTTDKLVVNNGASITGGTTTDTLHVTKTSTFDGTVTFKEAVSMNKDLSVGGNATVAGDVTAKSYNIGNKTYISESGINANNQKVVNVAPGRITADSTDAVNGSQLYQTNERVTGVENKVNKLDSRVDKVGANAAALANLHPLEFDADSKWNIAAAVGGYKGETATAIGAFYRPNENVMINVSSSFGTGENMYGGGISLRIGQGGNKARRNATNGLTEREKAMQQQINSLTNRLDALLSVINPNMSKEFPDVPENHWAYEAVSRLAGNGVIQGYEDGKYHGDRTMTRYEMAEIIYNALSKGAKAEKKLVEEFKPELQAMAAQKKA